jgi:hypothetical protein
MQDCGEGEIIKSIIVVFSVLRQGLATYVASWVLKFFFFFFFFFLVLGFSSSFCLYFFSTGV